MKRTAYNPETARTFYMNNTGHRLIRIDANGTRERLQVKFSADAEPKPVAVKFWQMLGNGAYAYVREPKTGKAIAVYPESETGPASEAVFMPYGVKYPQQ